LDNTLRLVLDAILDNAMIREVLFEGYVPRKRIGRLASASQGIVGNPKLHCKRFDFRRAEYAQLSVDLFPQHFPLLSID
jgi:hypothetical protein